LDPYLTLPIKRLYKFLRVPAWFPPEGIIGLGHLLAIAAAFGFAFATTYWWGGIVLAAGVAANHIADVLDGTHARATSQCRNGGELLDHFTDPLSFAYWLVGLAVSCGRLDLGLVAVICLYATAVLTNIKAKMIGEFTLAAFGPTEFKTLLVLYGLIISLLVQRPVTAVAPQQLALWFLGILIAVGIVQLLINLVRAIYQVNREGAAPDTTEWVTKASTGNDQDSRH
jgi:phosphatidylglycerophosphate synthase